MWPKIDVLVALITLVGRFPGVSSRVRGQSAQLRERASTVFALKRLLSSVDPHVDLQTIQEVLKLARKQEITTVAFSGHSSSCQDVTLG